MYKMEQLDMFGAGDKAKKMPEVGEKPQGSEEHWKERLRTEIKKMRQFLEGHGYRIVSVGPETEAVEIDGYKPMMPKDHPLLSEYIYHEVGDNHWVLAGRWAENDISREAKVLRNIYEDALMRQKRDGGSTKVIPQEQIISNHSACPYCNVGTFEKPCRHMIEAHEQLDRENLL